MKDTLKNTQIKPQANQTKTTERKIHEMELTADKTLQTRDLWMKRYNIENYLQGNRGKK